jgi:hypothetical protein
MLASSPVAVDLGFRTSPARCQSRRCRGLSSLWLVLTPVVFRCDTDGEPVAVGFRWRTPYTGVWSCCLVISSRRRCCRFFFKAAELAAGFVEDGWLNHARPSLNGGGRRRRAMVQELCHDPKFKSMRLKIKQHHHEHYPSIMEHYVQLITSWSSIFLCGLCVSCEVSLNFAM